MWANIEKTYCFIRHIGTVITAQDVIVAFFATASAIAINDEKIFRNWDAVQTTKIVFQRFSHQRIFQYSINLIGNSGFNGGIFVE